MARRRRATWVAGAAVVVVLVGATVAGVLVARGDGGSSKPEGAGLPAVDTGVLSHVEVLKDPRDVGDLERVLGARAGGLVLDLARCELRAPGRWVFSGVASLPAGSERAHVVLGASWYRGDMGDGLGVKATVERSGRFSLPLDRTPVWPDARGDEEDRLAADPGQDSASGGCDLSVTYADVPVGRIDHPMVQPTASDQPYSSTAPAGTLQALGTGARLGVERDPHRVWAYLDARRVALPLEQVWVPSVDSGVVVTRAGPRVKAGDPCVGVELTLAIDASVSETRDCEPQVRATDEAVDGADGFVWGRPDPADQGGDGAYALATRAGTTVAVSGTSRDLVARVARSLQPHRNTRVLRHDVGDEVSEDLDTAIGATLVDGDRERSRFERDGRWYVIATGRRHRHASQSVYRFQHLTSGWSGDEIGGNDDAPVGVCARVTASLTAGEGWAAGVTYRDDLQIQAQRDGVWHDVDEVAGTWVETWTPGGWGVSLRFVDPRGNRVNC
ncbi:MAG: hypothetical protein JO291_15950 [Acidimicrobiia bacterium]|nr:hypothetical protein [Acidimicrobiia bacterium]